MTIRETLWRLTEPTKDRRKVPTKGAVEAAADWLETWYGSIDKTMDTQLAIYQPAIGSDSESRVVLWWCNIEGRSLTVYVSAFYNDTYDMTYAFEFTSTNGLLHIQYGLIQSENDWLVLWTDFWK